jgi:FkbM family methyltransferase
VSEAVSIRVKGIDIMSEASSGGKGLRPLLPAWVPVRPSVSLKAAMRRTLQRNPPLAGPADVRWCYRLLLGREPEPHGLHGYVHLVTNNAVTRDELVSFFVSSPEFRDRLINTHGNTDGAPIGTAIGDLTIYVDPDDTAIGSSLRKSASYEPEVTATVRKYLKNGDCFVDCGASFGYFSALAGSIVGDEGSVISFEPGPQNQSLLLLNLVANGILTGEVHQVALSDNVGILRYGGTGANGSISPFDGDPNHLGTYHLVRSTTMDNIVGSRRVDMMKIDVEGAEGRVLRGAEQTLKRSSPILVFEFSPPSLAVTSGMSGEELLQFLGALGYSIDVIDSNIDTRTARTPAQILSRFDDTASDHIDLIAWSS